MSDWFNHVGFTGTHRGCRRPQYDKLKFLTRTLRLNYLHHGCCIGADAQVHALAMQTRIKIIGHPAVSTPRRMTPFNRKEFYDLHAPFPPLVRNGHIVDAVSFLVACPYTYEEVMRSGTWATVRAARKQNKPVLIIWPDGDHETLHFIASEYPLYDPTEKSK